MSIDSLNVGDCFIFNSESAINSVFIKISTQRIVKYTHYKHYYFYINKNIYTISFDYLDTIFKDNITLVKTIEA